MECHLEIDNQACDHRMRVRIQTPHINDYSYTDTPFGTAKRAAEDPHIHDWKELGWKEEPTAIFPMLHYVNTHDQSSSWTVFSKGIKEYQLTGEKFGQIALTLFRAVGFLGRPDLIRRPGIASGNEFKYIPTPDSQLLQKMTFKFAVQLAPVYDPAAISRTYLEYALSCPYYQIQELNRFTTTLKYFVSNPLENQVEEQPMIQLESKQLVFSSLRKSTSLAGFDLRVYNPNLEQEVSDDFIISQKEIDYEFVDLKGCPVSDRQKSDRIQLGVFKPGEIKTVHLVD